MIKVAKNLEKLIVKCSVDVQQLQHQQYMAQNKKRKLSDKEMKELEEAQSKLMPKLFASDLDPVHSQMSSPLTSGILAGLLGAAPGYVLGGLTGVSTAGAPPISTMWSDEARDKYNDKVNLRGNMGGILAALLLGGGFGAYGYFKRKQKNEDLLDAITRLNSGATLRDYKADPLVQKELDRDAIRGYST